MIFEFCYNCEGFYQGASRLKGVFPIALIVIVYYFALFHIVDINTEIIGVSNFVGYIAKIYRYISIDPIFNNVEHVDKIFTKFTTPEHVYNYKNEMLYVLISQYIYGIDLNMYEYFNMDISQIKSKIIEISDNYIDDPEGSIYLENYKSYPNFEDLKRYLVVLLSKA